MENFLECFYCGEKLKTITAFITHVKAEGTLPYRCKGSECISIYFGNAETLRSHMKKHFEISENIRKPQLNFDDCEENLFQDFEIEESTHPRNEVHLKVSNLRIEFLKVFLPIYSNEKIARKHAIENTKALCGHFKASLDLLKESLLIVDMPGDDRLFIEGLIIDLMNSVDIRSEYMLLRELEKSDLYVRSGFIEIARKQQEFRTQDNVIEIQDIIYGVTVFPLQQAFHKLFNKTHLLADIMDYMDEVKSSETMVNYIQGNHWKRILAAKPSSDDVLYLPLMLFFDDFEPNNPLGSHRGIHKLGGIYVKLLCLPPYLASKLWSIIVAMIFYTEDRKEFNNKNILKPLIRMLLDLENIGITLETPIGKIKTVKIITCLIVGDNLGLQEIFDCNSGFNSYFACRLCIIFKSARKVTTHDDETLLRKVEDYEMHVNNELYGVKGRCVFNRLVSFHIYNNFYSDIMHDILEGQCHYVFSKTFHIFRHDARFVNFKITKLNERILIHNFGPGIHARPLLIPDKYMEEQVYKFKKLPFSAAEMLTFTRHILLLLKGLVPECRELKLIRQLRKLVSELFTHSIQRDALDLLSSEFEDYLENYREICGDLQPKFHHLLHYKRIIEEVGPLLNIACFSFESAHQPLKKTAASSNNQINIPVTLHKKFEAKFCTGIINSNEHLKKITFRETRKNISDGLCARYGFLHPVDISELYYKGLRIQKHNVIQIGETDDQPIFVLIKMIVKDDEDFKLVVEELTIFNFDTDLWAYEVAYTNHFYTIKMNDTLLHCNFVSCVTRVFSEFYVNWI